MVNQETKYRDFDELVFEHRNKEYGAYDLRKSYSSYLTKAFIIGTSIFLAGIILPFVYITATEGKEKVDETKVNIDLRDVSQPELPEEEPIEEEEIYEAPKEEPLQSLEDLAPPSTSEPVATIQNVVPEPTQNAKNEATTATKEELEGKAISTKTQEGTAVKGNAEPVVKGVEGGRGNQEVKENVKIVDKSVVDNTIHKVVDKEAEFPGGVDTFRKSVQENFDIEAVEGEGVLTTTVTFVVERDGSITQVKAKGSNSDFNREAERVIKSIRKKWTPATKGNQNVRSYFTFPLKMRFE